MLLSDSYTGQTRFTVKIRSRSRKLHLSLILFLTTMGKGKRKRRDDNKSKNLAFVNQFSNITGYDGSSFGDDTLDGCMAELQQTTTRASQPNSSDLTTTKAANTGETHATLRKSNVSIRENVLEKTRMTSDVTDLDKVESWNRNFVAWVGGSTYNKGMLPSVEEELQRNFKVKQLSSFLLESGSDLRMPLFERWLIDSKLEDSHDRRSSDYVDPILPNMAKSNSSASIRLVEELCHNKVSQKDAEHIVSDLCRRSNVAFQELASQANRFYNQSPLNRGDRIEVETKRYNDADDGNTNRAEGQVLTFLYSRKKWRKPFLFKLNKSHYDKLRQRFLTTHNQTATKIELAPSVDSNCKATHAFHLMLLALLLRYSALSGGQLLDDLRGGGMQGAIHEQVFDVLKKSTFSKYRFVEGFASPFNAYLPSFTSAFPDFEWHFGSIGNFFSTSFTQGCYEANPPFSPGLMNSMVDHIDSCLDDANRRSLSLTFVVIVPTAKTLGSSNEYAPSVKRFAFESFQRMVSTASCRLHIVLPARDHGYIEGSQHLRPTRYKQSGYDTSVIILQSSEARCDQLDEIKLKADIVAAFASRHAEELSRRRKVETG